MDPIPSETGSTVDHLMEQPTLDSGKQFVARPRRRPGRRLGVRGARAQPAPEAQRRRLPEAAAGRRERRASRPWSGTASSRPPRCARAGEVVRVTGRYAVDARYGACLDGPGAAPRRAGEYEPADLVECSPVPVEQMEADLDELVETVQHPQLRQLLQRLIGRELGAGRALARGAGGQALPPGLPPRPVRALPLGRPGRERDGAGPSRRGRPRRRRHRRPAARHRQGRGLRRGATARSSSPTPASSTGRSRSATSSCAARSSGWTASRPSWPRPCCTSS